METIKGYKSVIFFVLALLVSLAGLVGFASWEPTADMTAAIAAITSLVGIILRMVTDTPVFKGKI